VPTRKARVRFTVLHPVTYVRRRCADRSGGRVSGILPVFPADRPTSVGRIDIASADFRRPPPSHPIPVTEKDAQWCTVDACCRRSRAPGDQILDTRTLAPDLMRWAADLVADFRARANTVYHPSELAAWANPQRVRCRCGFEVHGIEACASSTRRIPTSRREHQCADRHVAQKAADLILKG